MRTITITENNDWEGERWNFYIDVEDEQIPEIQKIIELLNVTYDYELDVENIDHHEINNYIKYGNDEDGYMPKHNYLGKLNNLPDISEFDDGKNPWYKGYIVNYCSHQNLIL